jgi:hypothetical protein
LPSDNGAGLDAADVTAADETAARGVRGAVLGRGSTELGCLGFGSGLGAVFSVGCGARGAVAVSSGTDGPLAVVAGSSTAVLSAGCTLGSLPELVSLGTVPTSTLFVVQESGSKAEGRECGAVREKFRDQASTTSK